MKGLALSFRTDPHPSFFLNPCLLPSIAVGRLDNFTGSYNQRCQPQMKMPRQMHFDSSQEEGDMCRPLCLFLKDSCCLWISGLPESLWHKWKVITISEIKTLGSDTTFSITQRRLLRCKFNKMAETPREGYSFTPKAAS